MAARCNASQDAQDAWDAEDASLALGRNAGGSDAGPVFADVDVVFSLHFRVPISCKIVFHVPYPYPLTLASGIMYSILRIVLLVICAYCVSTQLDVRHLRQGIHKVAFFAYRSQGSEWC